MEKIQIIAAILFFCFQVNGFSQTDETVFLTVGNTLSVPSGEKWELKSAECVDPHWYEGGYYLPSVTITVGGNTINYGTSLINLYEGTNFNIKGGGGVNMSSWVYSSDNGYLTLHGPATIGVSQTTWRAPNQTVFITYKKYSLAESGTNVSSTSVVIPSSAAGDVDVKMEQSADNVTWTECLPGTYNSSTVKRFFRLRAVEK